MAAHYTTPDRKYIPLTESTSLSHSHSYITDWMNGVSKFYMRKLLDERCAKQGVGVAWCKAARHPFAPGLGVK
ncbi:hypothetical protein E2C01_001624 [Portunus trituberculatus]|uniref:Uncharacterized protein n=1 Tax=Portunus trituberculatus TaxID=210409 RepID=A0A5B7CH49_PORTR|nr:hypothetical protein [Portunus trituberculatus]